MNNPSCFQKLSKSQMLGHAPLHPLNLHLLMLRPPHSLSFLMHELSYPLTLSTSGPTSQPAQASLVLQRGLPDTGLELSPGVLQERGQEEAAPGPGEAKEEGAGAGAGAGAGGGAGTGRL